jgi:hypothetical protein
MITLSYYYGHRTENVRIIAAILTFFSLLLTKFAFRSQQLWFVLLLCEESAGHWRKEKCNGDPKSNLS